MLLESEKKIGGNTHFSEIIKLKIAGEKFHTLLCILALFTNIVD